MHEAVYTGTFSIQYVQGSFLFCRPPPVPAHRNLPVEGKTISGRLVSNGTGALNQDAATARNISMSAAAAEASVNAHTRLQMIQLQMQKQQAAGTIHNHERGKGHFPELNLIAFQILSRARAT